MPKAIDVHVHPPDEPGAPPMITPEMMRYFRLRELPGSPEQMADTFQARDVFGIVLAMDCETNLGHIYGRNEYVYQIVRRWPDTFAGFGSVDPWKGKKALDELDRCAQEYGFRGIKVHPNCQAFFPNDPQHYPIWEKCQKLGLVVLTHTGMAGTHAGTPGGGGIHLKYSHPLYVDEVAADFPELTIIMAHPQWPWQDEGIATLLHKANVYVDLSGWSPKYIPRELIDFANNRLPEKVLFGSDYPGLPLDRWLRDFQEAPFKDAVRPKILGENAKRILKLDIELA